MKMMFKEVNGNDEAMRFIILADDDGVGGAEVHCQFFCKGKKSHSKIAIYKLLTKPTVNGCIVMAAYAKGACSKPATLF
jgi:hypothetical protein